MTTPGVYDDPPLEAIGGLIAEALTDPDLDALVHGRVRGTEPKPATDDGDKGDARGPGEYVAFITIATLDAPPHPSLPIVFGDYGVNCYGVTYQNASAVYAALIRAFHRVGARTKGNGLGIYQSLVSSGGFQDRDPDTGQPVVRATMRVVWTGIRQAVVGS